MAIVAPVAVIRGDSFQRQMKNVSLVDGGDLKYAAVVEPSAIGISPCT
jgi:hexosaminidase